jgi:hypothetical protein
MQNRTVFSLLLHFCKIQAICPFAVHIAFVIVQVAGTAEISGGFRLRITLIPNS